MKFVLASFFLFLSPSLFSQTGISNKNFNYFDLMGITNNHFHSQLLISATADEIGYNGELYKVKKNFFSLNFSASYKRLLPDITPIWVPLTLERVPFFPKNGILLSTLSKWYFNHRKFSFAGLRLYGGYLWMNDKDLPEYFSLDGPSAKRLHLFWSKNYRYGFDLIAGRKFVNKTLSEIFVEFGFRADHSTYQFQCNSACNSGGNNPIETQSKIVWLPHFQVILGLDIFSE